MPGRDSVPLVSLDLPEVSVLKESGGRDLGIELDVGPQVKPVGYVVEVGQNLGLLGVFAAPLPFLEQLFGEGEAVGVALGVASGAGIPVPVPRSPNPAARLVDLDGHPHVVPQPPQHPQPRESRPDHYRIEIAAVLRASHITPPATLQLQPCPLLIPTEPAPLYQQWISAGIRRLVSKRRSCSGLGRARKLQPTRYHHFLLREEVDRLQPQAGIPHTRSPQFHRTACDMSPPHQRRA